VEKIDLIVVRRERENFKKQLAELEVQMDKHLMELDYE